jgi:hypothetical protein
MFRLAIGIFGKQNAILVVNPDADQVIVAKAEIDRLEAPIT